MKLIKGNISVEWVELGEGLNGDYEAENPEDVELLRFCVYEKEGDMWTEVDDTSYCTLFPVSASSEDKEKALELLMDRIYYPYVGGQGIKKLCEELSWINPNWVKEVI